jgi:hypothetical protein
MSGHGIHVLTLVGPALALLLVALGADVRAWLGRHGREAPGTAMSFAAAFSIAAGAVHAVVCPEHFHAAMLYGWFFAVSAAAQLAWAGLVVLRPHRWVLVAGLVGNLAIIVLWAVTRTVGIPLGPEAGVVEAVGVLDVISSLLEFGIVICCALALAPARHRRPVRRDLVAAVRPVR